MELSRRIDLPAGAPILTVLEKDATAKGFLLIARKARAAAESN